MKYTKKQFLADVRIEADAIKANATKNELNKLSSISLDWDRKDACVYGLMTGYCRNERAIELITQCCKKFIHTVGSRFSLKTILENANGETAELQKETHIKFVSSIEAYISLPQAENENLIAYIKGESDKLIL